MADALFRLPRKGDKRPPKTQDWDLDTIDAYYTTTYTVELSEAFKCRICQGYLSDRRAQIIIEVFDLSEHDSTSLPYKKEDGLLWIKKDNGEYWLYIPRLLAKEVFQIVHDKNGHQGPD